jgi:Flp pilus assembly CpaF family ATPase
MENINNKQQNAVGLLIEEAQEWGEYKKTMTNNKQQTAVEKAKELIKKMTKQYALIAVDELIKDNEMSEILVNGGLQKQFWEEVKQEIENYGEQ